MDSNAADDDMLIRGAKEGEEDLAEEPAVNHARTAWSVVQRQKRQNKQFGGRNRMQRSFSLRTDSTEQGGFLSESLDSTSRLHSRSSASLTSSEEDSYRDNNLNPPPLPPRGGLRMARSATLPTNMPSAPPPPQRRVNRQQRSYSMALGPTRSITTLHHSRSASSIPVDLFGMAENQPENFLEENFDRDRKKPRARRASTLGTIPCLQSPSFQEKIASLGGSSPFSSSFLAESPLPDATTSDLFNSPGSRGSSRKRPVCGSPSSGDDGSTIMTMSSNTSSRRTRRLSPGKLPPGLENPLYSRPSHSFHEARGMNQESDEEESEANVDTSFEHDVSFCSQSGKAFFAEDEEKKEDEETQGNEILASMPAYEDLKFLVNALNQEKSKALFGGKHMWTVVPKQSWSMVRRSAFIIWLTDKLHFTLSPVGNGLNVLKIPAVKGRKLLDDLYEALQEYQGQPRETEPPSQVLIASVSSNHKRGTYRSTTLAQPPTHCALEFDLASNLEKLTVEDKPQLQQQQQQSSLDTSRLSFGSARPSFEPGALHLPGHETPAAPRAPMVVASAEPSLRGRNSSLSTTMSVAPMQNLEFVETPQIKQDPGWGSRPVLGRDWGTSDAADEMILQAVDVRMAEIEKQMAQRSSLGPTRDGLPCMPMAEDVDVLKGRASHMSIEEVLEEQDSMVEDGEDERLLRRRQASLAKHHRVSLCVAASMEVSRTLFSRRSIFPTVLESAPLEERTLLSSDLHRFPERRSSAPTLSGSLSFVMDSVVLDGVFSFLSERDLMCTSSLVCSKWYEASATAYARLMMASVGYSEEDEEDEDLSDQSSEAGDIDSLLAFENIALTSRGWDYLTTRFPWGVFLSQGGFKSVYKVYNTAVNAEEAISVMDVEAITDKKTIAAELVVSVLLSSISRRGICPNFVITRGVFTLPYMPPQSHWGCEQNKAPKGKFYDEAQVSRKPREPKNAEPGRYQFIRMELCNRGDAEDFISKLPQRMLDPHIARCALFQVAFALHVAAERFSLKHYDVKLLNVFVQAVETPREFVLRYRLGAHTFALAMPGDQAFIAKLADYGTANIRSESNGQPVTVAQFTTLENTPPEFMILGDAATQGHGHDNWGLGLCMLHLFTGNAPYEEILEDVRCPSILKKKLRAVWEGNKDGDFSVIRSVIRADVYEDSHGNIIEGEPDETLYDTLYRYLVLFGIPSKMLDSKPSSPVWKAIVASLQAKTGLGGRRRLQGTDVLQYEHDCRKYSIAYGNNEWISSARRSLQSMEGGLDLLLSLCSYDPTERATPLRVINSTFMEYVREDAGTSYHRDATVQTYDYNPNGGGTDFAEGRL